MTRMVVDVGNTETVVGIFRPGSLEVSGPWRYTTSTLRTPDELLLLLLRRSTRFGAHPKMKAFVHSRTGHRD